MRTGIIIKRLLLAFVISCSVLFCAGFGDVLCLNHTKFSGNNK
jgi:hypothetical protein